MTHLDELDLPAFDTADTTLHGSDFHTTMEELAASSWLARLPLGVLASEPERVAQAVEEVLRHEPITSFTARVLTADVSYRDVLFPSGTVVMIGAFTGNRDGAGDPAFDITADRGGARLLTFGAGIHFCLGVNLARAELEEALTFPAPRMPDLRLTAPPQYGTVQGIYGLDRLELAWS